jgi:hypothetical protein
LAPFTSQPSRLTLSVLQFNHPMSHATPHSPPVQLGRPWLLLHAIPQPPQLDVFSAVAVSHPSRLTFSSALQFA